METRQRFSTKLLVTDNEDVILIFTVITNSSNITVYVKAVYKGETMYQFKEDVSFKGLEAFVIKQEDVAIKRTMELHLLLKIPVDVLNVFNGLGYSFISE